MSKLKDDNYCFVCGKDNPRGLRLSFDFDEESGDVICRTSFPKHLQGWRDVLHGGIISTVLDEIMAKAVGQRGFKGVTAELNVRFKQPAITETEYEIRGRVKELKKRLVFTEAEILDEKQKPVAAATAKFIVLG